MKGYQRIFFYGIQCTFKLEELYNCNLLWLFTVKGTFENNNKDVSSSTEITQESFWWYHNSSGRQRKEHKIIAKSKIWWGAIATYAGILQNSRWLPILLLNHVFIYILHLVWDIESWNQYEGFRVCDRWSFVAILLATLLTFSCTSYIL